jgi:hypothetical protein
MAMQTVEFKLKQASAVLGVSAKDIQNLVQLKVNRAARLTRLCIVAGDVPLQSTQRN